MLSTEHVAALTEARRRLPRHVWHQLANRLPAKAGEIDSNSIRQITADLLNQDAAWILSDAFERNSKASWNEIAAAMVTVDYMMGDYSSLTEIIWSGPANGRFPVRRIDQVLYDLITDARHRIILVTFAAHRVDHLCELLTQAVNRGVDLTLILETEDDSDGQLTRDAIGAFRKVPTIRTRLYCWPLAKRERNQAGRPGKLHMKCAIVDDVALMGSANFTDDAFNRNMELGMLVREESTVEAISEHFRELMRRGVLKNLDHAL